VNRMYFEECYVVLSQLPLHAAYTRNQSRTWEAFGRGSRKCVTERYVEVCAYNFKRTSGIECMR
jgi:hypothetical protein